METWGWPQRQYCHGRSIFSGCRRGRGVGGGGKERRKRCRVAVGQNTLPTRSRGGAAWFLSRSDRPSASSLHDVQRQPCFCRSEGKRLPLVDRPQATTGSILIDPTCKSGIIEAVKRLHSNLRMNRRKIRVSLSLSLFLSILCIIYKIKRKERVRNMAIINATRRFIENLCR